MFDRTQYPCNGVPCVILKASELREGMIVHSHGMRVLLDNPVQLSKNHPVAHGGVHYCHGLVLNVDEIEDQWLVGITREYLPWPNRNVPTGEHRWTIQSNDLCQWAVELESITPDQAREILANDRLGEAQA